MRTESEYLQVQYAAQVAQIAADLHELANWVAQQDLSTQVDPVTSAGLVLARVHNALPNLPFGLLFKAANDIARFHQEDSSE